MYKKLFRHKNSQELDFNVSKIQKLNERKIIFWQPSYKIKIYEEK